MGCKIPKKAFVLLVLTVLFSFSIIGTSIAAEKAEPPSGIEGTLMVISKEEREILLKLFTLTQEIEVAEQEGEKLALEIEAAQKEIITLEAAIVEQEAAYGKKKEGLKQILKTYQRMGPGTYLEIVLNSESLGDFLRRVNTLRDITRNTGAMLSDLEESKRALSAEKDKLSGKLASIQEKQKLSKESLAKKVALKAEMDEALAALKDKKNYFEEQLANLQKLLEEIKPMLSDAMAAFSQITKEGTLPPDALKISFSLLGVKASIDDKTFNEILAAEPSLSVMKFAFHADKTEISLPEQNLVFTGNFAVREGYILEFQLEEGRFHEMPLERAYIDELLGENELSLDFKPVLQRNTIESVKSYEGHIELSIKPKFF